MMIRQAGSPMRKAENPKAITLPALLFHQASLVGCQRVPRKLSKNNQVHGLDPMSFSLSLVAFLSITSHYIFTYYY